jgi:hypothetical protein
MTHTLADRRAEFDLSVKLYGTLDQMTTVVEKMNGVRGSLADRSARLPAQDSFTATLQGASGQVDDMRKQIVATKEGGMITGEERLRENLANLYGSVVGYEGKPSATQLQRAAAIERELGDISKQFDLWVARELPKLNAMLVARNLQRIELSVP